MAKNDTSVDLHQKGLDLAKTVYEATLHNEAEEKSGLISQMRNYALSVPFNIADGTNQKTNKHATQYYGIARGFLKKLDTHIEITHSLGMIDSKHYRNLETQIQSVDSLLAGLMRNKKTKK